MLGASLRLRACAPRVQRSYIVCLATPQPKKAAVTAEKKAAAKAPATKAAPAAKAKPAPSKAELKKAGEKVKRAPSALQLFAKDTFPRVMEQHPEVKGVGERMKLVRQAWDSLSADKKAPYESKAESLKAEATAKREAIKADKKANAKPMPAFFLFANDVRPRVKAAHPGASVTEIGKKLGEAWKALPVAEKETYQAEYKANMEKWKAIQESK